MNVKLPILITAVLIILVHNIGCVNIEPAHAHREIGKPGRNYDTGDTFSSGTIMWEVSSKNEIKSKDGKFFLRGPKQHNHAIIKALEFVKEFSPYYYKMMRQVKTNYINYDIMANLNGYHAISHFSTDSTSDIDIGELMIRPYFPLAATASTLVHEIAVHGNEQNITRKRGMLENDIELEACLHQLNFLINYVRISNLPVPLNLSILLEGDCIASKHNSVQGYIHGYYNFIDKYNSTNSPELADLQDDLKRYRRTEKVSDLPVEGLIKHFNEYVIDKYPNTAFKIWMKYDPEGAETEKTKFHSKHLKPDKRIDFYNWVLDLDSNKNRGIEQIQSKLKEYLRTNNDKDFPIPSITDQKLYDQHLRSRSYKNLIDTNNW